MKVKALSLLAAAGAMAVAGTAAASFNGVYAELHTQWDNAGTMYDVYRLYADVDGGISFWGGNDTTQFNMVITNINADGTGNGSGFYRAPAHSSWGVFQLEGSSFNYTFNPEQADHSSYMTLGVEAGYNENTDVGEVFLFTPGFNPAGGVTLTGMGGVVSNPGAVNTLSVDGSVLLAQFSVLAGEHVEGTFEIAYFSSATGSGSEIVSFTTIPAPGALALLGLAGVVGARRRRA